MDIDLGSRIIVEFSNKERMTCQFVGLSKDEFVLIKVPMTAGIRDRLPEGAYLQFRYLRGGKIIGFGAEILRFQAAPVSLAFLSYPKDFSEYNLRHEDRIQCHFPSEIIVGESVLSGHIVDISPGGCKFVPDECSLPKVRDKVPVSGSFTTMEGSRNYSFRGAVSVVQVKADCKSLGIRFEGETDLPKGVTERLLQMRDMQEMADESRGG